MDWFDSSEQAEKLFEGHHKSNRIEISSYLVRSIPQALSCCISNDHISPCTVPFGNIFGMIQIQFWLADSPSLHSMSTLISKYQNPTFQLYQIILIFSRPSWNLPLFTLFNISHTHKKYPRLTMMLSNLHFQFLEPAENFQAFFVWLSSIVRNLQKGDELLSVVKVSHFSWQAT